MMTTEAALAAVFATTKEYIRAADNEKALHVFSIVEELTLHLKMLEDDEFSPSLWLMRLGVFFAFLDGWQLEEIVNHAVEEVQLAQDSNVAPIEGTGRFN